MRRLRLPAALTVTVIGVVAPVAAVISACSKENPPRPDAGVSAHFDARFPGDGSGSDVVDAGVPDASPSDAAVPMDAPPDTPIT